MNTLYVIINFRIEITVSTFRQITVMLTVGVSRVEQVNRVIVQQLMILDQDAVWPQVLARVMPNRPAFRAILAGRNVVGSRTDS